MPSRAEFESFLASVPLAKYRERYRPIKIVEMDLPKEIQAIALLYKVYWEEKKFLRFDAFYKRYLKEKKKLLEKFRKKVKMCKKCFYLGLPARIYRTWASLITQIQAGYVAESVFGKGTTEMSEELDHQGADFRVTYKSKILNYQVKKESFSREVRQAKTSKKQIVGRFIALDYQVPSEDIFLNPKKLDGNYKIGYKRFVESKHLKRLPNGFVIFTSVPFESIKRKIDSKS